ncbi:hypothetical protein JKM78_004811 [Citrobacter freundii]|uniref:hypothetical protein n=1 Tax=Citrobacter TaxID=544 RepID=UPI001F468D10|nr:MULTISPECIES: hypothetical protein [Citrobacter]MDM3093140.1 hypothetical protein [Citrobacter sp. Cf136]MDM3180788.1 hypothetical protein [Citrobacter sp. Cf108]
MTDITIPRLAMVNSITDHAIRRYTERRQSLPCFIIDDLLQAKPLTKARLRKLGLQRRRGYRYLRTTDRLLFVIGYSRVITCYFENTKVSTYENTGSKDESARQDDHRTRRQRRETRELQNSTGILAEID